MCARPPFIFCVRRFVTVTLSPSARGALKRKGKNKKAEDEAKCKQAKSSREKVGLIERRRKLSVDRSIGFGNGGKSVNAKQFYFDKG